ncbi:MAG: Heme/hemopexin transporter protein HuxB [Candidatus Anoxychlamydiales bacterium]|nr:Heme/hemopexin transporter protein HuxB [Candidatus Anoxychlamydiales bacterium]NGX41256.1 Heme/hemopexin transporter protein HuxB [Candidatus Anoxychlamydiales bacterium]
MIKFFLSVFIFFVLGNCFTNEYDYEKLFFGKKNNVLDLGDQDSNQSEAQQDLESNTDDSLDEQTDNRSGILVDTLKGIVLIGSLEDLKIDTENIQGVVIDNVDVPGNVNELKEKLKAVYLNRALTKEVIYAIKKEIIAYYKYYDRPVVTVLIPKQNISDKVLQIIILESKIDKIYVKNNKHVSSRKILNTLRFEPKDYINTDTLLTDIYLINKNPFLNANAILKPSDKKHKTDVEIFIEDIKPWRIYGGGDNSGTKFSDENRYFVGFNLGNLFSYNHMFSFQYIASDDFKKFIAYTGNYTMNYQKFSLIVFGAYSKTKPNLVGLTSKGKSSQVSVRVEKPIGKVYLPLQQVFVSGFDYKTSNNNITAVQEITKVTISNAADLTQFILGYKVMLNSFAHNLYNLNELYISPVKWLTHQTDNRYNALHPGAIVKYVYFRMVLDYAYSFYKQWKVHAILRAQTSSANLLPSEQFDLGGQDTIRGYENRLVTRDNAILITGEIRSSPYSILRYKLKKAKDELILVGFSDFGYGADHKDINNKGHSLLSIGAGIRYTISNNFLARFDWGYPILKVLNNKNSKIYLTATVSY